MLVSSHQIIANRGICPNATCSNAYKGSKLAAVKLYNFFSEVMWSHIEKVISSSQIFAKCYGISKGYLLSKFVNIKLFYMELYAWSYFDIVNSSLRILTRKKCLQKNLKIHEKYEYRRFQSLCTKKTTILWKR